MLTDPGPLNEASEKLLEALNYYKEAYQKREISAGEYQYHRCIIEGEVEWMRRRLLK